jgi:tetratricopeptide (TPR) repeat protein
MQLRSYRKSAAIFEQAAQGSPNAAALRKVIDVLRAVQPYEELKLDESDPVAFTKKFTIESLLVMDGAAPENVSRLLASEARETLAEGWTDAFARGFRSVKNAIPTAAPITTPVIADLGIAVSAFTADGDAQTGYRVHISSGERDSVLYLVVEDGACKLLAVEDEPGLAGKRALQLADAGNLQAAQQWLNWIREGFLAASSDDPLSGPLFSRFWKKGSQGGVDEIRLAAAALMTSPDLAELSLPILKEARAAATGERAAQIDMTMLIALGALDRNQEALDLANQLAAQYADSASLFSRRITLLRRLDRWKDVRSLAEERIKSAPDDSMALHALGDVAEHEGNYAALEQTIRKVIATGNSYAMDRNDLAWYTLFRDPLTEQDLAQAIDEARKSVDELGVSSNRHTLAALYAEAGNTTEARQVLYQSLEDEEPRPHDWYVIGRLAEQYGVTDAAISAYQKVEKPESAEPEFGSTYLLAQKRLAKIGAVAKKR